MQLHLQTFYFGDHRVELFVPDAEAVHADFIEQVKKDVHVTSPYWSQIWPAALALCTFIEANPLFVKDKQVLELAAGLGLPSFLAANFSKKIHVSDYVPEAVQVMQQTIEHHQLKNVHCSLLDWNCLPESLSADVLLLSDINYEPQVFETLLQVLEQFLKAGTTILLATPQRIMAKPFIEKLLPWCVQQEEVIVHENQFATILVLSK